MSSSYGSTPIDQIPYCGNLFEKAKELTFVDLQQLWTLSCRFYQSYAEVVREKAFNVFRGARLYAGTDSIERLRAAIAIQEECEAINVRTGDSRRLLNQISTRCENAVLRESDPFEVENFCEEMHVIFGQVLDQETEVIALTTRLLQLKDIGS